MQLLFELLLGAFPPSRVASRPLRYLGWGLFAAFMAMAAIADTLYS